VIVELGYTAELLEFIALLFVLLLFEAVLDFELLVAALVVGE
jgi:hypothetical protein